MATATKVSPVHCSACNEPLRRITAGNIIDYTHRDGSYTCQPAELEAYRAA